MHSGYLGILIFKNMHLKKIDFFFFVISEKNMQLENHSEDSTNRIQALKIINFFL